MDEKTLEKLNTISSRLEAHLQVAEFVDKNSGEDIKRLFKSIKDVISRLNAVETDIVLIKNNESTRKDNLYSIIKLITLVCVLIGGIYTLMKIGILNGTGTN